MNILLLIASLSAGYYLVKHFLNFRTALPLIVPETFLLPIRATGEFKNFPLKELILRHSEKEFVKVRRVSSLMPTTFLWLTA
jgi:hypothetical protein